MPELPEVEIIKRGLEQKIIGLSLQKIGHAMYGSTSSSQGDMGGGPQSSGPQAGPAGSNDERKPDGEVKEGEVVNE